MATFKDIFEATKPKKASDQPKYVYHSVTPDEFGEIAKSGIVQKNRLRTIFHADHKEALADNPGGHLIRVARKGLPGTDTAEDGTHRTKGGVTLGRIEVYKPYAQGGWEKLKRKEAP